jgi:Domain of unknown function (DUF4271)
MENIKIILNYIAKPAFPLGLGRFCFSKVATTVLFIGLFCNSANAAEPPLPKDCITIKNLSEDWLVFDDIFKDYVPYIKSRHAGYQSFSQYFDIENYRGYKLCIFTKADSYLFINGKLQRKLPTNNWLQMNIDSLYRANNKTYKLLVTLYSDTPGLENSFAIVSHKLIKSDALFIDNSQQTAIKLRDFSNFGNFSILFSLFLFAFVAFLFNFENSLLAKYFNIKDLFTIGKRFDTVAVNRPFDIGNIFYLIILSFSISLLLLVIEHNFFSIIPKFLTVNEKPSFLSLISQFFNLSFLILVLFLLKYFFLSIFGNLYQLDKITNLHYFKILQSTGIFIFIIGILATTFLIYPITNSTQNKATFIILIASFYILRLLLLFFIIIKLVSVKNLYLFSYLCIVELIPLFLGIRFALS